MDSPHTPKLLHLLHTIYGEHATEAIRNRILQLARPLNGATKKKRWDASDILLITYADSIQETGALPLETLHAFLRQYVPEFISTVHILPFFPYSSDYGFSVRDYTAVNTRYGQWSDVETIGKSFRLMVDLVINHASVSHPWFLNFRDDRDPGRDYFITMPKDADLEQVVRPRSTPLLTPVDTRRGEEHVWTTFSADQADLNFSNPEVLLEMLEVLRLYIEKGARWVRLDAIAYLWKEEGTSCIHLPETHEVVKLIREFAGSVHPEVLIVTETNVPHKENISYFGRGDEAHMVYQFTLPPLLLYTLFSGSASVLTQWARSLGDPPPGATFLNFTASHDGIGVRPLEGILEESSLDRMIRAMEKAGGKISTKRNDDGTESPYEINVSYFDAMGMNAAGDQRHKKERFVCSQVIMLTLKGIPAFYVHSLTATGNDREKYERTGVKRDLNRKNWDYGELRDLLDHPTEQSAVFRKLRHAAVARKAHDAFHPDAAQEVLDVSPDLFVVRRSSSNETITSVSNVTAARQEVSPGQLGLSPGTVLVDLLDEDAGTVEGRLGMEPYRTAWLSEKSTHE